MHEIFRNAPSEFKRLIAADPSYVPKCGHCVVSGSVSYITSAGVLQAYCKCGLGFESMKAATSKA
jgi:hypothetical protein